MGRGKFGNPSGTLKKTPSHPQKKHRLIGAFFVDYSS
jgi:hypothetical protein